MEDGRERMEEGIQAMSSFIFDRPSSIFVF